MTRYTRRSHKVECHVCHTFYETKSYKTKFCTKACKMRAFKLSARPDYFKKYYNPVNRSKICRTCSAPFEDTTANNLKTYCNMKCNLTYRLGKNLRSRINSALKVKRTQTLNKLIGCSVEQLKIHLENQFQSGMTWKNYGRLGWHIDHKFPLSLGDLRNPSVIAKLCHFSNLQPMWASENISKSNKVVQYI